MMSHMPDQLNVFGQRGFAATAHGGGSACRTSGASRSPQQLLLAKGSTPRRKPLRQLTAGSRVLAAYSVGNRVMTASTCTSAAGAKGRCTVGGSASTATGPSTKPNVLQGGLQQRVNPEGCGSPGSFAMLLGIAWCTVKNTRAALAHGCACTCQHLTACSRVKSSLHPFLMYTSWMGSTR